MKHAMRDAEGDFGPNALSASRKKPAAKALAITAVAASLVGGCGQSNETNVVSVWRDIGSVDIELREPADRVMVDSLEIQGTVYGRVEEDDIFGLSGKSTDGYWAEVAAPIDITLLNCESDKVAVQLATTNNEATVFITNPDAGEYISEDLTYVADDDRVYECLGAEITQDPLEALPKTSARRTIELPFGEVMLPGVALDYESAIVSLPGSVRG